MTKLNQKKKQITVLMSVYNQEKYLKESIESILKQTYSNFKFLIINDGSTDDSKKIINKFRNKDKRIKLINQRNLGLTKTLNNSLLKIKSKYVARMDADDISHPERLKNQLNEFLKNDRLVLLGTAAKYIDANGKELFESRQLEKFSHIKKFKYYTSPFVSPSVMFKYKDFKEIGFFNLNFKYSQDYDAWLRLIFKNKECKNLNIPLINVRTHTENISNKYKKEQGTFSLLAKQLHKVKYKVKMKKHNSKKFKIKDLLQILPYKEHPNSIQIFESLEVDPNYVYSTKDLKKLFLKISNFSTKDKTHRQSKARVYIKLSKRLLDKREIYLSLLIFLKSFFIDFFESINFIWFKILTRKIAN